MWHRWNVKPGEIRYQDLRLCVDTVDSVSVAVSCTNMMTMVLSWCFLPCLSYVSRFMKIPSFSSRSSPVWGRRLRRRRKARERRVKKRRRIKMKDPSLNVSGEKERRDSLVMFISVCCLRWFLNIIYASTPATVSGWRHYVFGLLVITTQRSIY